MTAKDTFTVYAQYNEDIILAALLSEVKNGFYVDVGANHEKYHSVTRYFYDQGWRGINIEPIPRLIAEFKINRKKDTNLQLAISRNQGELELRDYPEHDGLSTLSSESKEDPAKVNLPHKDYKVGVDSLRNIFAKEKVARIDFLKIDVEGYESEVIESNDWKKYRPSVVCIEANHRVSDWSIFLESKDYIRIIFDGLNEYYLASESKDLFYGFAERATLLHHNSLLSHHFEQWTSDLNRIKFLEDLSDRQDAQIKATTHALGLSQKEITEYSLKNRSYLQKIRMSLKSLTIDYFRQKSRNK